ncbi:CREB-regulated transcription coactivator 3 [Apodemus speciosus]|uniref:CREB-regulated transcription coactivator 3 n=1 Tax=Apodemus speciosus TaxID=105296 RepID=A0ABQ0EZ62_APOSI
MAASPGSGSANPRKFSEKIALHTQRQAEETRAFEQLMTDLTLSRVQFQKLQQLRLTQYHGGSLPNVSQLRSSASEFQIRHFIKLIMFVELATMGWWRDQPGAASTRFTEGLCDGENDGHGEVAAFPGPLKEENLLNVPKPLPKQLWETKEIQSLSGRPRSCDVGGNAFPHNGQNTGLSPFLGTLNTGGSLPDLTNLHYSAPLPASLDTSNHLFGSMSVGNSVGNLPAAMTHLGIRNSPGLQSSRSNPSIQATLSKMALSSSLKCHPQPSVANASALHPSIRLFSLSNPSLPTTNLSGPSRRRQPPVSPLTLSPGPEAHQGFSRQLSATSPLNPYPASQMVTSEQSPLSFLPTDAQAQVSPPPPYPTPQELPQPLLQQPHAQDPPAQQPQAPPSLPQSDLQLLTAQGSALTSFFPDMGFDQQPMRPSPAFPQQVPLVQQSHREPQDSFHLRPNLYSSCGSFPSPILTEDTSTSLFKGLGGGLSGMPEVSLDMGTPFPLEEELQIEPLSLDGLNMLSDSSMGLLDPSVEETFRADRL